MPPTTVPNVAAPAPGQAIRVTVEGVAVAVFNVGGALYGIDARCTHVGGPLEKGQVSDQTVTCPWHGSQFNLSTGSVVRGPAMTPTKTYKVRSEGGSLVFEAPAKP